MSCKLRRWSLRSSDIFRLLPSTHRALTALMLSIFIAACGTSGQRTAEVKPSLQRLNLEVGGVMRHYLLFTPVVVGPSAPMGLVLLLHGSENSADDMRKATRFDEEGTRRNTMIAYPEGTDGSWNGGYCCRTGNGYASDDVAFLSAMIRSIRTDHDVDSNRVYAAGFSAGGVMAYRFACERAAEITGVAVVSATIAVDDCHPSRAVTVLAIHGTEDTLVPYEGGPLVKGHPALPVLSVLQEWAGRSGCDAAPVVNPAPKTETATWSQCRDGSIVRLITVKGGGHVWFSQGLDNDAIDATRVLGEYFGSGRLA